MRKYCSKRFHLFPCAFIYLVENCSAENRNGIIIRLSAVTDCSRFLLLRLSPRCRRKKEREQTVGASSYGRTFFSAIDYRMYRSRLVPLAEPSSVALVAIFRLVYPYVEMTNIARFSTGREAETHLVLVTTSNSRFSFANANCNCSQETFVSRRRKNIR